MTTSETSQQREETARLQANQRSTVQRVAGHENRHLHVKLAAVKVMTNFPVTREYVVVLKVDGIKVRIEEANRTRRREIDPRTEGGDGITHRYELAEFFLQGNPRVVIRLKVVTNRVP